MRNSLFSRASRHILILMIIMCLGAVPVEAKYEFSSKSTVERCENLEKDNEAMIKSLKKQYDVKKVTIERWDDGNLYYILKKNKTFARADMNGNLIKFTDWNGKDVAFFLNCHNINQEGLSALKVADLNHWTIAWNNKRILNPALFYEYLGISEIGGKKYIKIKPKCFNQGLTYYTPEGVAFLPYQISLIEYFTPGKTVELTGYAKTKYKFKSPENMEFANLEIYDNQAKFHNGILLEGKFKELPGKVLNTGAMYIIPSGHNPNEGKFKHFLQSQVTSKSHFDWRGKEYKRDTVLSINFKEPIDLYLSFDNSLIADSIMNWELVSGTSYYIFERVSHSNNHKRGLFDLGTKKIIPPVYDDLYVNDKGVIMGRQNKIDQFAPVDATTDHQEPIDPEYSFQELLMKVHNGTPLTEIEQKYYSAYIYEQLYNDIIYLADLNDLIERDQPTLIPVPNKHMKYVRTYEEDRSINTQEVLDHYNRLLPYLHESALETVTPMITELAYNFSTLEESFVSRHERDMVKHEKFVAEQQARNAKLERLKKARENVAKIDAFLNELSQFQAIVNEAQARQRRSSKSSTASSGAKPSGGHSSSSGGKEDVSDRIAFLKGQIIDWKNKLKKAEKSYEDVMGSGEDTWEKKRVIDSKRQTVDECLQMIKQYEAELLSLQKR